MRNSILKSAVLVAILGVAASSHAILYTFNNPINGAQEVPSVVTSGSGTVSGTFDSVTRLFTLNVTVNNLIGNVTDAHVHKGVAGVSGGVVFGLGGTRGSKSYTLAHQSTITAAQAADLLANAWYVNVHTSFRTGGEVRGQILPVPEPMTMVVLGAGLIAASRRRSKR
jgi:hypothetical protein